MCGIVGGVADGDVLPHILEALRRLEYRGYDSAGVALVSAAGGIVRRRSVGRVAELSALIARDALAGSIGIGHTRWATHGGVVAGQEFQHPDWQARGYYRYHATYRFNYELV